MAIEMGRVNIIVSPTIVCLENSGENRIHPGDWNG
jgi:hypothetical protein